MRIIGCDLHARQQTLAMLDTTTGEVVNRTLQGALWKLADECLLRMPTLREKTLATADLVRETAFTRT